jgi:hypothetical protein
VSLCDFVHRLLAEPCEAEKESVVPRRLAASVSTLVEMVPYRRVPDGLAAREGSPFRRVFPASSCEARWSQMEPVVVREDGADEDKCRRCSRCGRNLYNLAAMSEPQADALIRAIEPEPFVRLFRRSDGSVLTSDCPVGARAKLRRGLVAAAIVILAVLVACVLLATGGGGG